MARPWIVWLKQRWDADFSYQRPIFYTFSLASSFNSSRTYRRLIGVQRNRKGFPIFSRFLPELLDTMIPLDLPPLQERKNDIPLLLEIFLEQFNQQREAQNEKPKQFADLPQIHQMLQAQNWRQGNIAQLRMVVEEVLLKTAAFLITPDDFKTVLEAHSEQSDSDTIEVSEKGERRRMKTTKPPLIITDEDLRRFGIR